MDAIDRLLLRADVQAGIAALQRVDHGEKGFFVLAVRALVSFVSSRPFLSIEDRRAIGMQSDKCARSVPGPDGSLVQRILRDQRAELSADVVGRQ